jgi:adenylyltransferase/sulfurtransferase
MCIYGEVAPDIGKVPVVGTTPATIAALQVTEALKLILGIGVSYSGKLLLWDGADMTFRDIELQKNPNCPVCGGTKRQ